MTYTARLPLFLVLMISPLLLCASEDGIDMKVISVYQIEDEEGASLTFLRRLKHLNVAENRQTVFALTATVRTLLKEDLI